jgi:pyrimidine oxygenase
MTPHGERLLAATKESGRDVGALALFMVIADETDELAMAKWHDYHANADLSALDYRADEAAADVHADADSTARTISLPEGAVNFNMGTLIGSYASVARMLDELSTVPGVAGVMLTFDDFVAGVDAFGERIQPLMASRQHVAVPA